MASVRNPKQRHCEFVVQVNTAALLAADLAVFIIDDSPTFGVPIEINQAVESGISVVVWWKASKSPGLYLGALARADDDQLVAICYKEGQVNEAIRKVVEIVKSKGD
jgi:hypothetical protein